MKIHEEGWKIEGDLNFQTVGAFITQADAMWRRSTLLPNPFVIHLSKVSQVDSSGLALLLNWKRQAHEKNIQLQYKNPPLQLRTLLKFYQFSALLAFEEI